MKFVILFFIFMIIYTVWMIKFTKNKKAKALGQYNDRDQIRNAPHVMKEWLDGKFAYLKDDVKSPIDAYTQCKAFKTLKDDTAKIAKQAAKRAMFKAVGGAGRSFQENPIHSFLVISGQKLHYLQYQAEEDTEHQVFSKEEVSKASITVNEKSLADKLSQEEQDNFLLTISNAQGEFEIVILDSFPEMHVGVTNVFGDEFYQDQLKLKSVALLFRDHFKEVFGKVIG